MDTKAALVSLVTGVMSGVLVTIVIAELLAATIWLALVIALPVGLITLVVVLVGTYRYLNIPPAPRSFNEYTFESPEDDDEQL